MRDPHVVWIRYDVKVSDEVSFRDPAPVEKELDGFSLRLEDLVLTCTCKEHFSTVREARGAIEPFLRSWEISVAMQWGRRDFRFVFRDSEVLDRDPIPGQLPALRAEGRGFVTLGDSATCRVIRGAYPEPLPTFVASPDVETLWNRFEGWMEGKEPLLSMAYFGLTVLESLAGGRRKAASEFRIDYEVLDKLGELTSERGDGDTARKMPKKGGLTPLTASERQWIEAVIPKVTRQVGEASGGGPNRQLRMQDLPVLS